MVKSQTVHMNSETEAAESIMKWNNRLRHERKQRGWTQSLLAEKIGTNTFTVNRWENGNAFPSRFYREQLSKLLGKSLEELGLVPALEKIGSDGDKKTRFPLDSEHSHNEHHATQNLLTSEDEFHTQPALGNVPPQARKPLPSTLWLAFALSSIAMLAAIPLILMPKQSPGSIKPVNSHPTIQSSSPTELPSPQAIATLSLSYEAEAPDNTANGIKLFSCNLCSGGLRAGWIGHKVFLQFNNINVDQNGSYTLKIYYLNSIPNRVTSAFVSVDGGPNVMVPGLQVLTVNCCNNVLPQITEMTISLHAGDNTIKISNPTGPAPDIDRIAITKASQD